MIVTIDGPSGTGKTTISKLVAERLGFSHFDTGAMYRSVTWFLLDKSVDLSDLDLIQKQLCNFKYDIKDTDLGKRYYVNNKDVTDDIRSIKIVSVVSAFKFVRALLLEAQRQYGYQASAVFEGRDLGSVVFPNAEFKFFLTASASVRSKRRLNELLSKNPNMEISEEQILESINKRDEFDSTREIAPLKCPEGAIVIDTSNLTIDQVVNQIINCVLKK